MGKLRTSLTALVSAAALTCSAGALAAPQGQQNQAAGNPTANVTVVHLTKFSADPHAAMMALMMANALQAKGVKTALYLDVDGVRLADQRQPIDMQIGPSQQAAQNQQQQGQAGQIQPVAGQEAMSLQDMYNKFVNGGGQVMVESMCAQAIGLTQDNLRKSAQIVQPNSLANVLMNAQKVIDY
jgi:predicted peroxiredoxin